jgi:GTPase SAR1 family protein
MEMLTDWLNDARDNSPRGVMFVLVGTHIDKESQREVTK